MLVWVAKLFPWPLGREAVPVSTVLADDSLPDDLLSELVSNPRAIEAPTLFAVHETGPAS